MYFSYSTPEKCSLKVHIAKFDKNYKNLLAQILLFNAIKRKNREMVALIWTETKVISGRAEENMGLWILKREKF